MKRSFLIAVFLYLFPLVAFSVEPSEILDDPALEQRAREIPKGLRCLVCQNESIDDSNASLAKDLRVLVRERILACLLYTSPSPRDREKSRMPSSA